MYSRFVQTVDGLLDIVVIGTSHSADTTVSETPDVNLTLLSLVFPQTFTTPGTQVICLAVVVLSHVGVGHTSF